MRVEVIDREEIEEKALMTPGSVAMLLGETTGLRVQTTSPALGAANVRIQGLRGRYSQLVADGLPLYGAQGDSFSLLQVPPLDLAQVEIIKGAASALYGASALGGVINLVSRRPAEAERELLVNATSQSGHDVTSWLANPIGDDGIVDAARRLSPPVGAGSGRRRVARSSWIRTHRAAPARILGQRHGQDDVRHDRRDGRRSQRRHIAGRNASRTAAASPNR